MGKTVDNAIDSAAKRARLQPRKNPYWQGVAGGRGGLSLGFRKSPNGRETWVAKIVIDGHRIEEKIGSAASDDANGLGYPAAIASALTWGKEQAASIEVGRSAKYRAEVPTVRSAVQTYVEIRKARSGRRGSEGSLEKYVLSDKHYADTKLSALSAERIEEWRGSLARHLAPSTKNRILNDLRAALNAAAGKYRRQIPTHVFSEIKFGTKAESAGTTPRRQLLTEGQVLAVVERAFEVDGDFGNLVLLAAATGARFSQLASLTVADVQVRNGRLMMPSSQKGKNREAGNRIPVPVGADVLGRIRPILSRRQSEEPLLLRWSYCQIGGPGKWKKDVRQPWQRAYQIDEVWKKTVKQAGVPTDTIMYALRHSSIVRGLRAGLPVSLVASLHDTSIKMIEKHYAAFIIDMTEDLARKTLMKFGSVSKLQAAE